MAQTVNTQVRRIPDPWSLPIEALDPSQAELFQQNLHGEYFRRLRQESPVHYCRDSQFGPYWSITRYNDIVQVDANHRQFSSKRDIVIGDAPADFDTPMFNAQDPPIHDVQRRAVQPAVAPSQLPDIETLIRQRVNNILNDVPIGEPINWVEHVSKELTTQMLATLFDFPFEDRHLLPYWSDVTTASETVGIKVDMKHREAELTKCLGYFMGLWKERAAQPPKFDFISLFI